MPAYNPVNRRDSYATDFESVHFKSKQTTGPEFYDRSNFSRKISLVGVGIAAIFGWFCIFEGFMIFISKNTISSGVVVISLQKSWQKELLSLGLNLVVTACTETIGFVHSIALRSSLASQQQLHFNTNLRLLSAASGWFNPNGTLCNIVMAILLIVSYSSSLLVALSVDLGSSSGVEDAQLAICVSEVPLIVMGVALLLQAVIALASARSADILTWSSSPFDITAALVHHAQIIPEPGQCMRSVGDRARGPVTPSRKQPSAWAAHSSIARVVITLWTLVILCIVWGIIIVHLSDHSLADAMKSWTFFPQPQSHVIAYSIPIAGGVYWYWVLYYINMAAIQGPLTLGLHCSELVVNVIRDEKVWRNMTTAEGTSVSSHPLALVFGSTLNVGLLVLKPLLHWMLGLAISLAGTAEQGYLTAIAVSMWPFQIVNYSVALLIFSLSITVIVLYRPKGPQPAAYGHVQTLANLIDEWSPTMWWGHKEKGFPFYHAGTSDCRLPKVDMNALYA
ncbi:hypothetical protein EV363DRAFT_1186472 [Boletus edulis]|uniref:Uncharacterized protein n=1 Tax=Boletus edulis BED1 TaxID=1328754 RepID=A0AAD4C7Y3_BOLED|nr:hypothetical protein EV363DRAFT_1186472 [Boletus edulis]KAF8450888.1 hypothetical protein L210DRAFT_3639916 [Boletus edulis BED1]